MGTSGREEKTKSNRSANICTNIIKHQDAYRIPNTVEVLKTTKRQDSKTRHTLKQHSNHQRKSWYWFESASIGWLQLTHVSDPFSTQPSKLIQEFETFASTICMLSRFSWLKFRFRAQLFRNRHEVSRFHGSHLFNPSTSSLHHQ